MRPKQTKLGAQARMDYGDIVSDAIFDELRRAEAKFPGWPDDLIHGVGILVEEVGETMQAALQHVYEGGSIERVKEESTQAAAMAMRLRLWLEVHGEDE